MSYPGYPPQHPGYPPQHPAYPPPQHPAYPPPQGYPVGQQHYPPLQGYPPTATPGLPPQGYPTTAAYISQQVGSMSLQSGPPTAGDSPLLSVFADGNTIFLNSVASGNNLRIRNGEVEGTGGQGKLAQFIVHVRRPGVIALQNVNADSYLAIYDGRTIGTGRGGPYCEFLVGEIEGKHVTLESAKYPGHRIGIKPDGSLKQPGNTGTGNHGRFVPSVYSYGTPPGTSQPHFVPQALGLPGGLTPPDGPPSTDFQSVFADGNTIFLNSVASGNNLRIRNSEVEGTGGQGKLAQFIVHARRPGVIALQNVNAPDSYLAIRDGRTIGTGRGGPHCEFLIRILEGKHVTLESDKYPGHRIGIKPDGSLKNPGNTGTGNHGRFVPSVYSSGTPPGTSQPPFVPAGVPGGCPPPDGPPSADFQSVFADGNTIFLNSVASGNNLRIRNGEVEGTGGQGRLAQFIVHARRPGVIALQNVNAPDSYLAIYDGRTIGTGRGGPHCEFLIRILEGKHVTLESDKYPGHHIGIKPDGSLKKPGNTGTGNHARFVPSVYSSGTPPGTSQVPPPCQPVYPGAPGGCPPPHGPPPPLFPSEGPTAPSAPSYPQLPYYTQPPPPQVQGPQIPSGHNVLDAFRSGNIVQLMPKSNGYPLTFGKAEFVAKGVLGKGEYCNFIVVTPPGVGHDVIMLQCAIAKGSYPAIGKDGIIRTGGGGKWCHFRPMSHADNYVSFESVEMPGSFLCFESNGSPGSPSAMGRGEDPAAQFFVRVENQVHPHSTLLMTPFGQPSIANKLTDNCVIQLYLKRYNQYLSINSNGIIINTANGNDPHTFFRLRDRGMGIYSLDSYKYSGFRLRIDNSTLTGKGMSDLTADFRLMENHDGTVCFASVLSAGSYLSIVAGGTATTNLNIFLVSIQKFGRSETITKVPLN